MQQLTPNAIEVLRSRYLLKNEHDCIIESPTELFRRVAAEAARAETEREYWEEKFFNLVSQLVFLPNSPALMNARTLNNQLSACFVLPIEEGIENIFDTLKLAAIIQQYSGGTGFNFSALPGINSEGKTRDGNSPSPLEVMEIFNASIERLKPYSKRAGANMGILNVNHPDIIEFIRAKKNENVFQNFNLSIGITDAFIEAVKKKKNWELTNKNGNITNILPAHEIWNEMIQHAWMSGDPGLIFLDEINRRNPVPAAGKIMCTNPCGEVPLLPYEACTLGSINLTKFISQKNTNEILWDSLEETVFIAIRMLDNIVSTSNYIYPKIINTVHASRKLGLGVMGWAEMLIMLKIPYCSQKAIQLAQKLMAFINMSAHKASYQLALEKGNFPDWEKSIFYNRQQMRNATCTSIAPTGSIAIIAGTSPSIEPLFALAFTRQGVLGSNTLSEVNPYLFNELEKHRLNSTALTEEIFFTGKLPKSKHIPHFLSQLFLTAPEIPVHIHLTHQAAFQKYTDNAVSKTINLPEHTSEKEVHNAFMQAWKLNLKGVTIFREGCRKTQVIQAGILKNGISCGVANCND